MREPTPTTCPICGRGTLVDLAFDERGAGRTTRQTADSAEVRTYECGHEVVGPSLALADPERMDVERRASQDTVDPPQPEGAEDDG